MADDNITLSIEDGVAHVHMDDGKANAFSPAALASINSLLDEVDESDAGAVVISGREGRLSGGFDLKVITGDPEGALALLTSGIEMLLRLYANPRPVVVACTGHAVALGAMLLLSVDKRVGTAGDFKLGLNETAIGMNLPYFALLLARERLARKHLHEATQLARLYNPTEAVDVGFLDQVVEPGDVIAAAVEDATRLAQFSRGAFALTRKDARGPVVASIRNWMDTDLAGMMTG